MEYNISVMAILIPVITILIAVIVAWTGYQQYRVAKEKLKFDLFEKRFSVYKGVQIFLSQIMQKGELNLDSVWELQKATEEAKFLFEDEIPKYIDSIRNKALKMWAIQSKSKNMPTGDGKNNFIDKEGTLFTELTNELSTLSQVFMPYLKFSILGGNNMKRPASLVAAILLLLIAIAQLCRFFLKVNVIAGGVEVPLWPSAIAVVVLAALAIWLLKERSS